MSIFPKRTKPGGNVTIHLGLGLSKLSHLHQFTYVEIDIIDPNGEKIPIFNGNIFSLPIGDQDVDFNLPKLKAEPGLRKNVPYLLIADYLGGNHQKDQVFHLLKRLHNGRHYYFTKTFDEMATLGKYHIESTFYVEGEPCKSNTKSDDYFFLEHLVVEEVELMDTGFVAQIHNPSPEIVPAIVVECQRVNGNYKYDYREMELPPKELTKLFYQTEKSFLLYNEQREVLPLIRPSEVFCVRNQKLAALNKKEENTEKVFVFNPQDEQAFELEGDYKRIWDRADGLISQSELEELANQKIVKEMISNELIREVFFE